MTDAVAWFRDLKEKTNTTYLPLFFSTKRYLVLKGSAGSGKSVFAGDLVVQRCAAEAGHRYLVCRKIKETLRESCYEQLIASAAKFNIACTPTVSPMKIKFPNGSEILFAGLDDVMKLKSIFEITDIWIEEASEILEEDFAQLDIRMRGATPWPQQMIITFNPVSIMHWLKRRFFDEKDPDAVVHESTYKDNRWLPERNIKVLESFKDKDPYYYAVYCLGEWGVTGVSVFDANAVTEQILKKVQPIKEGCFTYTDNGLRLSDVEWADGGAIKIYAEPEPGVPYVIGADTAGAGSDKNVAQVIDNRTGRQVACLRCKTDEDVFARQLYCLGLYYNTALIGVETNLSTYPVMELERLGYPKQYVRQNVDDYTHSVKRAYGFRTDAKTRPLAIATFVKNFREDPESIVDKDTLEEMLTFVRNDDFRPEAEYGAHDDTVMAMGIALSIRNQQSYFAEAPEPTYKEWSKDMWEDYYGASAEDKEYLIRKWGRPRGLPA